MYLLIRSGAVVTLSLAAIVFLAAPARPPIEKSMPLPAQPG
jgi:hypothetical protein